MKHKHAELIKAWADGAAIQVKHNGIWSDVPTPAWASIYEYRIKTGPKPDVEEKYLVRLANGQFGNYLSVLNPKLNPIDNQCNLKLTFDGETHELKSAEVIK